MKLNRQDGLTFSMPSTRFVMFQDIAIFAILIKVIKVSIKLQFYLFNNKSEKY